MKILPLEYYHSTDVVALAQDLLGKVIRRTLPDGTRLEAEIVETEAYSVCERASHAYAYRHTKRTATMFLAGGHAYVYLCYGIHHLLNIVVNSVGAPEAVLIRGVRPLNHQEIIRQHRGVVGNRHVLTNGPGKLTQALAITRKLDAHPLIEPPLQILDNSKQFDPQDIVIGHRIGVDYAGEDAKRPWRFWVKDSPFVSRT